MFNEIVIQLTRQCNLRCKFCFARRDKSFPKKFDIQTIDNVFDNVLKSLSLCDQNHISFTLLGGELFSDDVDDDTINHLTEHTLQLQNEIVHQNKTYDSTLMTNLITTKVDRIIDFAHATGCEVHSSFDFIDRFENNDQIDLWFDNFNKVKQTNIQCKVGVVLTKSNIQHILQNDEYWNKIYQLGVYLSVYEPKSIDDDQIPSETLIDQLFNLISTKYQDEQFTNDIVNCYKNGYQSCVRSVYVNDQYAHRCCDHDCVETNNNIRLNCFNCKYYNNCPNWCPRTQSMYSYCIPKIILQNYGC